MRAIEINLLIDRLEALLIESRQVPFSPNVMIDRERCYDIINQMRTSIPEEVKKAKRVKQERDRIIAQANEEAERIIELAREQATELVSTHEVIRQAEDQAKIYLERVQREAQETKIGADDYAYTVLKQLEEYLIGELTTVRNGILSLDETTGEPVETE